RRLTRRRPAGTPIHLSTTICSNAWNGAGADAGRGPGGQPGRSPLADGLLPGLAHHPGLLRRRAARAGPVHRVAGPAHRRRGLPAAGPPLGQGPRRAFRGGRGVRDDPVDRDGRAVVRADGELGPADRLPFAIEGIAFFIEAIFLGIYLYGWDRLPPRVHLLSGLPIFAAGVASAFFVVCANSWMNTPAGFTISHGRITHVDPWAAMFNPASGPETTHMILAALMVTGFGTASVYAVAMLRGRRDRYHRLGLLIPLTAAAILTPLQIVAGDWAARMVAAEQPTKLAAMEGLARTTAGAPESLFGYYGGGRLHGALR